MNGETRAGTTNWGHDGAFYAQPSRNLSVEFAPGPSAAAAARNALVALRQRVDAELLEDLRLLVSELVTNSVRHSRIRDQDHVVLDVSLGPRAVRVEVRDPGEGFEHQPREPGDTRAGGWGLYLVDRLADRWGVVRNGATKVWFEIDRRPRGTASAV